MTISTINTITAADRVGITGGETWTGTWEDVGTYGSVSVWASADAPATLWVELSDDGLEVRQSVRLSATDSSSLGLHRLAPANKYMRPVVIAGAADVGVLLVQVKKSRAPHHVTTRLGQSVTQFDDAVLVRVANSTSLDTARGVIGERTAVDKFGAHADVGTAAYEDIWTGGGTYPWPTTALAVRVAAGGNAADTAAGAGARQITVVGLDANWVEASETLATAGASASAATTTTFIRIYRCYVSQAGTYTGNNVGDISIETTAGTTLAMISAGNGQTQMAMFSVPAGKTAYITQIRGRISGSTVKTCTVKLWQRHNADTVVAPFGAKRLMWNGDEIVGGYAFDAWFDCHLEVPAKSDIWFSAISQTNFAAVTAAMCIELIDNP